MKKNEKCVFSDAISIKFYMQPPCKGENGGGGGGGGGGG